MIKSFHKLGENRIEITLNNGQALTVMVHPDSGKISILSNSPHMVGDSHEVIQKTGRWAGQAMPQYIVDVSCYGHPFED